MVRIAGEKKSTTCMGEAKQPTVTGSTILTCSVYAKSATIKLRLSISLGVVLTWVG